MSDLTRVTRRRLLAASAFTAALAACGAPAAPTPPPAKPAEAPKPAEPPKPAATAAEAPKPAATAAEAAKPAAAPTTAPAAAKPAAPTAAKPGEAGGEKPGRHLIGKLEGPTLVLDPAQQPTAFNEAPMLADLVKQGKLPPLAQRLPAEPLVIKPLNEIGKYGGTWRRGFTGPADQENGNRINAVDKLVFVDHVGTKLQPSLAKAWTTSEDGKTFTFTLRKGVRWSDGQPFTADDVLFWFEDIVGNKDLTPIAPVQLSVNGKAGTLKKVDDLTVSYSFPEPYYLFEEIVAGNNAVGDGLASGGRTLTGGLAPKHYMKQFHPKYAAPEELEKQAKAEGFENWVMRFKFKIDWSLNTDLPVLTPWRTTTTINKSAWVLERNPYFWAVDAAGNQLPYIDKIQMTLAENLEVLNLRAMAGEYDVQGRHESITKLTVLLDNQQKSNYTVRLDPGDYGADMMFYVNMSYDADAEIAKWLNTRDFRRALSLGIERDQLNETFWLGTGTPGSPVVEETHPHSPGPEYRKLWATYEPAKANAMLDAIGLDKKDGEGFRLRTDGKGRLKIDLITIPAFMDYTGACEMIARQWRSIGIFAEVKEVERGLQERMNDANQLMLFVRDNTTSDSMFTVLGSVLPVVPNSGMGPEFGKWYSSGGRTGRKPTDPQILKTFDLFSKVSGLPTQERNKVGQEIWKIFVDEVWGIGTVGLAPGVLGVRVVKNNVGNVPQRLNTLRAARMPGGSHPSTYYFKS